MKKSIIMMLMLFVGTATVTTSCKKEDKKSEKEKNTEVLTSGKWYIQIQTFSDWQNNCFNEGSYFLFKTDGTVEHSYSTTGTYTVSNDGKSVTVTLNYKGGVQNIITYSIVTATNTSLVIKAKDGDGEDFTTTLAKTVAPEVICF